MYKHILLTLISALYFALGLSAQDAGQTAFTFNASEEHSTLQQLMEISESNPNVKELFFLEEQPEMQEGTVSVGTATGPNSFAYGNLTAAEMYAKILQIPTNNIFIADGIKGNRYNLFYHSGGQPIDDQLRTELAHRFLDRIDIKVSQVDSVATDRMVFTTSSVINQSLVRDGDTKTAWTHNSPLRISVRNKSLSQIFREIQKQPLYEHYQLINRTGLSQEQTLNLDLNVETVDDFIASAAAQGLNIEIQSGRVQNIFLAPK